ncbi:MAG: ribose 5-phosphate isomerase B [Candidatus Izemoplasmatales bacterium]|jgi:ribose 5-phosphate isomerase B|nr:ribose 5-phosphate isomerase B [Candidatus Izemoplasmatales bacterium]NLF48617.1 ribose 5-phosphate isomerase B [Acholeplasmataceae bacterium]MDD4354623.1 ribose 5-phosphate isomerase B [Candidatus Izemoplasmatales bacterium]MDD4987643.1 ribose 5-phosphate isomerase B [Candidatus Izemoplasmatales bacterium]MDD5601969.1 ribose 5-phosphate isomerase B [Candidatus Izemoplasmatales bacterium]
MRIAIGSDHAGFVYKEPIINYLKKLQMDVIDLGPESAEPTDYPIYARKVAETIRDKHADFGILICGTGEGMSIAANKVKGVIAGIAHSPFTAKAIREHNRANVLCLGSRTNTLEEALGYVEIFLNTEFSDNPRHLHRVQLIEAIEGDKQ